jgi:hypothetical protein
VSALLRCFFLGLALLGAACTNLDRSVRPGRDPAALRVIHVATNFNDNHRLAEHLAVSLRARGLTVSTGPLTLVPPEAEAVLRYEDRWSWDFGQHLTYLRLGLHDPGELQAYATATRTRYIARSTDLATALPPLLDELFAPVPR